MKEHAHHHESHQHGSDMNMSHGKTEENHATHIDHTGHEETFRKRFWISLLLSIPTILYDPMIQEWLGFTMPYFPGSRWMTPLLAVFIFFYGGLPFVRMAIPEWRQRRPGMMMLISLAITVAFGYSVAALFMPGQMGFFWELVTLIDMMLLGHWIEMRSVRQASGALDELARLLPDTAERIEEDGSIAQIPATELRGGDRLLIRPGTSIPADGEVEQGESEVNESMITGESKPVFKRPGDRVIAGTINADGSLRIRVTATGQETALAGIMRLVKQAQESKSKSQVLADKAANLLFYVALGVAALTALLWTIAVGLNVEVIARVATVLVIACPHALGLAVPLVVAITTAMGARNGILVRDRMALEKAREINMVVFDKTGTLTEGTFGVVTIAAVAGRSDAEILTLAAALERDSEHPIAQGIRKAAENRNLTVPEVVDFEAIKGRGVKANHDGKAIFLGGPRLLEMIRLDLPEELMTFQREANQKGETAVYVIENKQVIGGVSLADVIRPESKRAVEELHAMGVEVAMLTGDSNAVARAVAEELKIDRYFAEVLPEHKDQKIAELQRQGKRVAMVGDGVNDAPALTRAEVGIAIGSGTDVAIESAGIILVRSNPLDIVKIIRLSRASYRKMYQNLWWAAGYNVVALPLAAGILAPYGIVLSPAVGALLMSLSTIVVAMNAQLLRRTKIASDPNEREERHLPAAPRKQPDDAEYHRHHHTKAA